MMQAEKSSIFYSSYIARERIKQRAAQLGRQKLNQAMIVARRRTLKYADIWIKRMVNRNFALSRFRNLPLSVIKNRIDFLRILKKAMQNLGLLAMPSLRGFKFTADQLKILAIIRSRKISLFMFMIYLHHRSKEIIVLNNRELKNENAPAPAKLAPANNYNHGISKYNEITNVFRNEINQTKIEVKNNAATYWQDRINNERKSNAQQKSRNNSDWKNYKSGL